MSAPLPAPVGMPASDPSANLYGITLGAICGASFFLAKKSANHSLAWTAVAAVITSIALLRKDDATGFKRTFLLTFLPLSIGCDHLDPIALAENVARFEKITALFSSIASAVFLFKRF